MVIYSATYWWVYLRAPECDILLLEALFKFLSYTLSIIAAAYVSQVLVRQAYQDGNEILTLTEESQVDGVIICEKEGAKIKYCSPRAKQMLDLAETGFFSKLVETEFVEMEGLGSETMQFDEMIARVEMSSFRLVGDAASL